MKLGIIIVNYEMRRVEKPKKTSPCTEFRFTGEVLYKVWVIKKKGQTIGC